MISAKEAKVKSTEYKETFDQIHKQTRRKEVEERISYAISRGAYVISIKGWLDEEITRDLRKLGYKVTESELSTMQSNTLISWE